MIQEEKLDLFRDYIVSGGLMTPSNLVKGRQLKLESEAASAILSALVPDAADYARDGVDVLTDAIKVLVNEFNESSVSLAQWNAYIEEAATQEDLTQVAMGVEVIRLLADTPNDTPAPSILPITSKAELVQLELAIEQVRAEEAELTVLMDSINAVLVVTPPAEGGPAPEIPPLSQDLIDEAQAKAPSIIALNDVVKSKADVIAEMAVAATSERSIALVRFQQAIEFTIGDNQINTPSIEGAAREIFPTG